MRVCFLPGSVIWASSKYLSVVERRLWPDTWERRTISTSAFKFSTMNVVLRSFTE